MDANVSHESILMAEIESKVAQIGLEAQKLARQAHRSQVTAEDVSVAWAILSGKAPQLPSDPADIKLLTSSSALRPLPASALLLTAPTHLGAASQHFGSPPSRVYPGQSSSSGSTDGGREAAAVLAALTASIHSVVGSTGSEGSSTDTLSGVAVLLAQLAARDAGQLRHVLPALTAALRSAMEACIVEGTGDGSMILAPAETEAEAGGSGSRHKARLARLRRILELVAAMIGNPGLPAEDCSGELLALTASILLHALPWSPAVGSVTAGPGAIRGSGAGAKRARVDAAAAAATQTRVESAVMDEARLRAYAAEVFAGVVSRAAGAWPQAAAEAADMLLDRLADSMADDGTDEGVGSGSFVGPVACWETAYGAVAGLAHLQMLSPQHVELLAGWDQFLLRPLADFESRTGEALASGVAEREGGLAGVWAITWTVPTARAVQAMLNKHVGQARVHVFV